MLVNSSNYSYKHGNLSASQKQEVIVVIVQKRTWPASIWDRSPWSRLMSIYGNKAISKRMDKVLLQIIHHKQNAYVKGGTIFYAVRTIDDVISFMALKNISSLMIAVDFEKAFDSVNWNLLRKTLEGFNFGPSFIAWIKAFYSDIKSCAINNSTPLFKQSRDVRQGDPLSSYLFIVVVEILAINIQYINAEALSSKKIYSLRNIKTTYSEKQIWRSICFRWPPDPTGELFTRSYLNALLTLNLVNHSILYYYIRNFCKFDWLRAVVFQLNLKYLEVSCNDRF